MKGLSIVLLTGLMFAQKPTILNSGFVPFYSKPYLTPTESPVSSININWNTATQESSIVAYGLTMSLKDTVRLGGVRYYHHVRLDALKPSQKYYYKVLSDGDIKTFKTFPDYADSFDFVAFGDTRSDSVSHQAVVNRIADYDIEFLLHSGDLVCRGDKTEDWITFFNIEDTLLQSTHFLPAIGNHERPYWTYDTLFALPDAKYFYSVDYGNAHFVMLSTEMDMWGAQRNWLNNDLVEARSDTSTDWIFIVFHRPPYTSGSHGIQMDVRDAWCSIFEKYGVDVVFTGHDHHYERTIPINDVVYIVTAGGGAPLYDVEANEWTACSEKTHHFCLTKIRGKKLSLYAIKPDGVVFDSLFLDKH